MGVTGSGKSTVMAALAERLGWRAAEGDEFHSPANVAKMASGVALTDEDRRPWLAALGAWIGERESANGGAGENALVSCSALKRSYRDLLRDGHPSVRFVDLDTDPAILAARLERRQGHYMPPSMLAGQLATLEPLAPDEPGVVVSTDGSVDSIVEVILAWLAGG